jgi:hypothetical protein
MGLRELVERLMLGKKMTGGVPGTAYVFARSEPPRPTPKYIGGAKLNLVVQPPQGEAYKVKLKCSAPGDKYPPPGSTVPVLIDPHDPQRVQVDWDSIFTAEEQFARL